METIYQYSAHFAGRLCEECLEHFSHLKVGLYRSQAQECPSRPDLKRDFMQLSDEEFGRMAPELLAAGVTDEGGNLTLRIDPEKSGYGGECIEVVITLEQIGGRQLEHPEHFRIAVYQPAWEQADAGLTHFGDFVLPANLWCAYLKRHGIWVICGRVTTCTNSPSPVGNVTVTAFDVDWIQDDTLGSALTDAGGRFIIYYDRSKFDRTPFSPFLNFEWVGGPDVYFRIEGTDTEGNPVILLDEPRSRGRKPDRENVSNCFCVQLCAQQMMPPPDEVPMWTHIGHYQIPDSADLHDFTAEGYTKVGNKAFYDVCDLIGQTGTATAARPLRYRFLYAKWTGATAPTPTDPVTKDMIGSTQVGVIIKSYSPLILEAVYVNNPAALHNHEPDPVTGWIEVEDDQDFTPVNNKLISLITSKLAPGAGYANPSPNPDAGDPAPADSARQIQKFALRYELEEKVGSVWTPVFDQTMDALVINNANTLLWLELSEFISAPHGLCQPITDTVTAKYTADHPHLDWYEIEIEKQGAHMAWPLSRVDDGGSLTFRGGNGSVPTDVSAWDNCSYIVILRAHRRLTNGDGGPGIETTYRTFCKS